MKTTIIIVSLVIALLAGCQKDQQLALKEALGDTLVIAEEVRQIELAKCLESNGLRNGEYVDCPTADRIKKLTDRGQKIYDSGDFGGECDWLLEISGIAYDWLADKYPDKAEYRIPVALLRSRLLTACEVKK